MQISTTLSVSAADDGSDDVVRLLGDDVVAASDRCPPGDGSTSSSLQNLTNDCDSKCSAHTHAHDDDCLNADCHHNAKDHFMLTDNR